MIGTKKKNKNILKRTHHDLFKNYTVYTSTSKGTSFLDWLFYALALL